MHCVQLGIEESHNVQVPLLSYSFYSQASTHYVAFEFNLHTIVLTVTVEQAATHYVLSTVKYPDSQ